MIIIDVIFLAVSFMGGTVSVVLVFCDKALCFLLLAHLIRTGKDFFRKPGFVGIFMDFHISAEKTSVRRELLTAGKSFTATGWTLTTRCRKIRNMRSST